MKPSEEMLAYLEETPFPPMKRAIRRQIEDHLRYAILPRVKDRGRIDERRLARCVEVAVEAISQAAEDTAHEQVKRSLPLAVLPENKT